MNPYIMIWDIDQASTFSLSVTGGIPFTDQTLHPNIAESINPGYPYGYVLFDTLNVDIYSGSIASGKKIGSTTIRMVTQGGNTYPLDDNNILQLTYDGSQSKYPSDDYWKQLHYFKVAAPGLQAGPPIITNAGWSSGQGNTDSKPTVGENFWVQDYGMDENGRWTADGGSIYQSTEALSAYGNNVGSRAYPIHIENGAPAWDVSGGVGVAFDGVWQIDIKIGSNGQSDNAFCETFYLAERANLSVGPSHYADGSGGAEGGVSREIDILETKWNGDGKGIGPQVNLPNGGNTGWNPNSPYINKRIANWSDVGGAPTKDFITFGCLIRDDTLWFYAYTGVNQWYCSEAIPKNSAYDQKYPFAPYIGTWSSAKNSGGFKTGYKNFIYLPHDNPKIAGKNPKDNPSAFGQALIA